MLTFACPICSSNCETPDEWSGKMVACGVCGAKMTVPSPRLPRFDPLDFGSHSNGSHGNSAPAKRRKTEQLSHWGGVCVMLLFAGMVGLWLALSYASYKHRPELLVLAVPVFYFSLVLIVFSSAAGLVDWLRGDTTLVSAGAAIVSSGLLILMVLLPAMH